jgi:hypothetical protein
VKTAAYEGWISLDSLVRIETYQWVTRDFPGKSFPRAFSPDVSDFGTGASRSWACGIADLSMGQAYFVSAFLQEMVSGTLGSP